MIYSCTETRYLIKYCQLLYCNICDCYIKVSPSIDCFIRVQYVDHNFSKSFQNARIMVSGIMLKVIPV